MKGALAFLLMLAIALPMLPGRVAAIEPGGLYGGTVTVAVLDDLNTDPATAGAADLEYLSLAYDSLAKRSATDNTPVPWLALNWSVSGTTVTFYLRTGATWADGTALTAADIAHAYNTIYNLPGVTATAGTGTVAIAFTANGGTFWADGVYLPIAWKNGNSTRQPGSGPYKVSEDVPGDHVTLVANPGHWNGRPYLDAVTVRAYTSPTFAACALVNGDATVLGFPLSPNDLTNQLPNATVLPGACNHTTSLLNETSLSITRNPGLSQLYLGMNAASGALADPDLRRGIASILDKDLHHAIDFSAYNEIADSLVVPGNFYWFNPNVPRYRMDKTVVGTTTLANFDRVNRELDLAGFLDRDSDGWREDKSGTPFQFSYLVPSVAIDPNKFTIAQNLETNLGRIGIRITTEQLDFATINARVAANNFGLYVGVATVSRDPAFYFDLFHSSRVPTGTNLVNLNAPALDALLVAMRDEVDPAQRQTRAWDVQQWVGDNVPWAPILHYRHIDVTDKTQYTGWVNSVGGVNNFWSYTNLHVIEKGALSVTISTSGLKLPGGKPADFIISVVDGTGTSVAGASVELTATDGTFDVMLGTTGSNGQFATVYNAPSPSATMDVTVTAMASLPGYTLGTTDLGLTVTPPDRSLRVTLQRPTDPRIASGGSATVNVSVLDDDLSLPIAGASVRLTVSPSNFGATITPTTGVTDSAGRFSFTFTGDVSVETQFRITAEVSASGFPAVVKSTYLLVAAHVSGFQEPPTTPGPEAVLLMVVTGALALAFARRRRRRPDEA